MMMMIGTLLSRFPLQVALQQEHTRLILAVKRHRERSGASALLVYRRCASGVGPRLEKEPH